MLTLTTSNLDSSSTTMPFQAMGTTNTPILEFHGTRKPVELTQEQKELINKMRSTAIEFLDHELKTELEKYGPKQKQRLLEFCTDSTLRRFLVGQKGKLADAIKSLKETLKWRMEYKPEEITWESVEETAKGGYTYFNGFDKDGYPIVYIRKREVLGDAAKNLRLYVYLFEVLSNRMPMGYEKVVLIFDFVRYSRENAVPLSVARELLHIMSSHYPETLGVAYMLNAPWIFTAFWTVLSPFLDPVTKAKVCFTSATNDPSTNAILNRVDPDQFDAKYGGNFAFYFDLDVYGNAFRQFIAKTMVQ